MTLAIGAHGSRRGHFSYHEGDPTLRTYSIFDDARRDVVPMAVAADYVAVDIETDGLAEESYVVKVIIITTDTHACVLDGFNPDHVAAAKDAIKAAKWLAFHNSEFDVPPLYHAGVMDLDDVDKVVDTLILARMALTDSMGGRDLASLEQSLLKVSASRAAKDRFKQWAKINKMSVSTAFKTVKYTEPGYTMYAGWDGITTHRIVAPLVDLATKQLTEHPFGKYGADAEQAAYLMSREQIVNRVMLKRSCIGLAIDPPKLHAEQERLMEVQSGIEQELKQHGVERPTNPSDLIAALQEAKALPDDYPWTKGGKNTAPRPSTAGENLEKLTHPAAVAYMKYADGNRFMNYMEKARSIAERTDGRLHPTVSIMKAVTGRMAYGLPALQQFIEAAREMIMFDDEEGTSIDWSQIEPVIGANMSGDLVPLEVYEKSGDLYTPVARMAGIQRKPAKTGLLGAMYGIGLEKLANNLTEAAGRPFDQAGAQDVLNKIGSAMPRTWALIAWSAEWTRLTGKTFTMSGRIVDVHPNFAYRGTNYTIQGSGYDLLAESIAEAHRRGMDRTLYLAFHDEVITSKRAAPEWVEIMSTPPQRMIDVCGRVPVLRVDTAHLGRRWRTGHDCACGSGKALSWQGDDEGWKCGEHAGE